MKLTFIAYDGKLTPATDEAEAWTRKIKPGDIIEVDVVRPRSQQFQVYSLAGVPMALMEVE